MGACVPRTLGAFPTTITGSILNDMMVGTWDQFNFYRKGELCIGRKIVRIKSSCDADIQKSL